MNQRKRSRKMQPDFVMDYPKLLNKGYVWRVHVEMPMQDTPGDDIYEYTVTIDVVSPTQALAQYIALSLIHISEPTRRTPISYAVFCLKK